MSKEEKREIEYLKNDLKEIREDLLIMRNLANRLRKELKDNNITYLKMSAEELILLGGSRNLTRGRTFVLGAYKNGK